MKKHSALLASIVAFLAAPGCSDSDSVLGPIQGSPEDGGPSRADAAVVASIQFEDGKMEFIVAEGTVVATVEGDQARRALRSAQSKGPMGPAALYEAISGGAAPDVLEQAAAALGDPSPADPGKEIEDINYVREDAMDDPDTWRDYFYWVDKVRADMTGNLSDQYIASGLHYVDVHSASGVILVRLRQRYYDIWSGTYKWNTLVSREVSTHRTLSLTVWTLFEERFSLAVSEASSDRWHYALDGWGAWRDI